MTDKTTTAVYIPSKEDWEDFATWLQTPENKILPLPTEEEEVRRAQAIGLTTNRKFILPNKGG